MMPKARAAGFNAVRRSPIVKASQQPPKKTSEDAVMAASVLVEAFHENGKNWSIFQGLMPPNPLTERS